MNLEAMREAIRVVESIPDARYAQERWVSKCGEKRCAAGHCGDDPWFQERGFTTFNGGSRGATADAFGVVYDKPSGESLYGFDAVREFFGLPRYGAESAHALFGSDQYEDKEGRQLPGGQQRAIFLRLAREAVRYYEEAAQKGLEDIL